MHISRLSYFQELKKLFNQKLGLNASKIKRPKHGSPWLFACFQNDEERTKAIAALDGYLWKGLHFNKFYLNMDFVMDCFIFLCISLGKTLKAEIAKPAPDPLVRKRKQEEENPVQDKKKKQEDRRSQEERIKDATTPYWNMPYEEQVFD